jgi:lactoylglutathione lyase
VLSSLSDDTFTGCFLGFSGGGKLELMQTDNIESRNREKYIKVLGFTHLAFQAESGEQLDAITDRLKNDGYELEKEPCMSPDGFYESAVFDPDNNIVEITCKSV